MTDAQFKKLQETQAAYVAADKNKSQAEAETAVAQQVADAANKYATTGVKQAMAKLQSDADAANLAAYQVFQAAFQKASESTNTWGAALKAYQDAIAESMTTPGAVENTKGTLLNG